jgi:tetratricopeptide (TPR) repeat protein
VDYVKTQMESFRNELRGDKGFSIENLVDAIQFAAEHNTGLDEALQWSDYAINTPFPVQKNFKTLSAKAAVLNKMGKTAEADALMKQAVPMGNMMELQQYGRKLISEKKTKEALEIFKMNAQKNPNNFVTYMGLMRGYSANGDFKNALKNAQLALQLAPDQPTKDFVNSMIKKLNEGKDVN